jgi:hypothetical protein
MRTKINGWEVEGSVDEIRALIGAESPSERGFHQLNLLKKKMSLFS